MTKAKQEPDGFRAHRATLLKRPVAELVRLIGELYRLSPENRRFLSARLGGGSSEALLRKEGNRLVVEPVRRPSLLELAASWDPLDEDFPEIEDPLPHDDVNL